MLVQLALVRSDALQRRPDVAGSCMMEAVTSWTDLPFPKTQLKLTSIAHLGRHISSRLSRRWLML